MTQSMFVTMGHYSFVDDSDSHTLCELVSRRSGLLSPTSTRRQAETSRIWSCQTAIGCGYPHIHGSKIPPTNGHGHHYSTEYKEFHPCSLPPVSLRCRCT